jgi:hypothetical protein
MQSTMWGEGNVYAPQHTAMSGVIVGSLPVGIQSRNDSGIRSAVEFREIKTGKVPAIPPEYGCTSCRRHLCPGSLSYMPTTTSPAARKQPAPCHARGSLRGNREEKYP